MHSIVTDRFIVGCGAVVTNGSGLILIVRQAAGYWGGQWIFPGGKLEMGETLEACARREVKEETGLDVEIEKQIGAYVSYDPQTSFEKQVVLVYFHGKYVSGIPAAGDGVTEAKWQTPEQLENLAARDEMPAILIKVLHDELG